jgi:hypothetical protein
MLLSLLVTFQYNKMDSSIANTTPKQLPTQYGYDNLKKARRFTPRLEYREAYQRVYVRTICLSANRGRSYDSDSSGSIWRKARESSSAVAMYFSTHTCRPLLSLWLLGLIFNNSSYDCTASIRFVISLSAT